MSLPLNAHLLPILAGLVGLSAPALAADIRVPADAATIQAAIDLAQPGDRVLVAPGVYPERIDFSGKDIVVESDKGAATTVIDGGGTPGFVVRMTSGESRAAVLRGFTVTGGVGQGGSPGAGPGGGIRIAGAAPTIDACIISANIGVLGGGIAAENAQPLVQGSRFELNHALQGGAIYLQQGTVEVRDSVFEDNTSVNFGGAMAVLWDATATVADSSFSGNSSNGLGGALYANHASLDLTGNQFIGNGRAEPGNDGVSWTLHTLGGGAIYTTGSSGRIEASRLLDNIAAFGTGLYVAGAGTLAVVNTLFAGNGSICNCGTGVVYLNSASPRLVNSTLAGNGGFAGLFTTYNAFPSVVNSIIDHPDVPTAGNGVTRLDYSLYTGAPFAADIGIGNVQAAPVLDAGSDYAPLPGSPAIDAGDNLALPAGVTTDLLGNARRIDDPATPDTGNGSAPIVDIGAIERRPPPAASNRLIRRR